MLTVCSRSGRRLILEYGLRRVQQKGEPGLSLGMLPSGPPLVCFTTLVHLISVFTKISDLEPFWNTQKTYWESANVTATTALHYSYPEFNGLDLSNKNAVRDAIGNYVNQQYGGGGSSFLQASQSLFAQPPAAQQPVAAAASAAPFHSRGGPQHPVHTPGPGKGVPSAVHDWTARIHFKKYELGGSFAVLIFLGDVPADTKQWRSCSSYVGSHAAFVNSAASQCSNCRSQENTIVEGFVHLNSAIAKKSGLNSYEPEKVTPYLQQNLHWRIQAVRAFPVLSQTLAIVDTLFDVILVRSECG